MTKTELVASVSESSRLSKKKLVTSILLFPRRGQIWEDWPGRASDVLSQIPVKGFPADTQVSGHDGFFLAGVHALFDRGDLLPGEGAFSAGVDSAQFGLSDSLPLAFPQKGALELGKGTHDGKHQVRHRRVFPGERQSFLHELDPDAAFCQVRDEAPKVVEVPGQAVQTMDDHGIAVPHEVDEPGQLGAFRVGSGGLVGEDPDEGDSVELPVRVLVEARNADIADALVAQGNSCVLRGERKSVTIESKTLEGECQ